MSRKKLLVKCAFVIGFVISFCNGLLAQEPIQEPERLNEIQNAVVTKTRYPKYPNVEINRGGEGWVVVSYIVDIDGSVKNAMIEDSVGGVGFEKASLDAINRFEYEPARKNGMPVSQSMTRYVMRFAMEGGGQGAGRRFIEGFTDIMGLIEESDEDTNDEISHSMIELKYKDVKNLYESAWYGWLEFQYLYKFDRENREEIIKSLRSATMTRVENSIESPKARSGSRIVASPKADEIYLSAEFFVVASRMLFLEYLKNNEYSAALRAYDVLLNTPAAKESPIYEETIEQLSGYYEQVIEYIDGGETFFQTASIGSNDYWVNELLRPSFSIENVNGELTTVDIRCSGRNAEYSFIADQVWSIPESWGLCSLYLKGEEGATFEFYSIP